MKSKRQSPPIDREKASKRVKPGLLSKEYWKSKKGVWTIFVIITVVALARAYYLAVTTPPVYVNIKAVSPRIELLLNEDAHWIVPLDKTGFKSLLVNRGRVYTKTPVMLKTDDLNQWLNVNPLDTRDHVESAETTIVSPQPEELRFEAKKGSLVIFIKERAGELRIHDVSGYLDGVGTFSVASDVDIEVSSTIEKAPRLKPVQRFQLRLPNNYDSDALRLNFETVEGAYTSIDAIWASDSEGVMSLGKREAEVVRAEMSDLYASQVLMDGRALKDIEQPENTSILLRAEAVPDGDLSLKISLEGMKEAGIKVGLEGLAQAVFIDKRNVLDSGLEQLVSKPLRTKNLFDSLLVIVWLYYVFAAVMKTAWEKQVG